MNRMMASALISGAVLCGAQAFANDQDSATMGSSTSMTNPQAVHHKLMKDCMDQQMAQGGASSSDVKKACQAKVKDQMQQMNDAGTLPPSSVPDKQSGTGGSPNNSGYQTNPGQ
jgi:hypothetical protein